MTGGAGKSQGLRPAGGRGELCGRGRLRVGRVPCSAVFGLRTVGAHHSPCSKYRLPASTMALITS